LKSGEVVSDSAQVDAELAEDQQREREASGWRLAGG
jgi:hypothetical protein